MSDFFKDLLFNAGIGLIAGSVATIISHPFDTIKIHIQIKKDFNFKSRTFIQNIKWFYSGVTPCIIGYSIEKSLIFGTYLTLVNNLKLDKQNILHTFFAGLTSGLVASISITAFEQIKTDLQLKQPISFRISHLYKGLYYTAAREGIGFSIYFNVYNQFNNSRNNMDSNFMKHFKTALVGSLSAFLAWIPIYPIDINKSRVQSNISFSTGLIAELISTEGFRKKFSVLYRGYHIAMLRSIPFHSTCFVIFEIANDYKVLRDESIFDEVLI